VKCFYLWDIKSGKYELARELTTNVFPRRLGKAVGGSIIKARFVVASGPATAARQVQMARPDLEAVP